MATSANDFGERDNPLNKMGQTVVHRGELLRHTVYTRFLHWMVGIFFLFAGLTGFGIYVPWVFRFVSPLFGGGANTRFLHPWFGCGFAFFFTLQLFNWKTLMQWTDADTRWMGRLKSYIKNEEK